MITDIEHIDYNLESSINIERYDVEEQCNNASLHLHNDYEIVYVKNGKGKIRVDNSETNYSNGLLVFLGPNIPHFGFCNNEFASNYEIVIHFNEDFVSEKIKVFPELFKIINLIEKSKRVIVFDQTIKDNLDHIFEQLHGQSHPDRLITVLHLLNSLSGTTKFKTLLKEDISNRYFNHERFKTIFDYINSNYNQAITTNDIANKLGLTTNSFCRIFKKATNKTFLGYVNEFRIKKAIDLIENSTYTISEIAYNCGFEHPSYFIKKFKEYRAILPSDYRKEMIQKRQTLNY